jgi:hypothetical protein
MGSDSSDIQTITFLNDALNATAIQRDQSATHAVNALKQVNDITLDMRLMEERNEQFFRQIEEALTVSIRPLEKVFNNVGLNFQNVINTD